MHEREELNIANLNCQLNRPYQALIRIHRRSEPIGSIKNSFNNSTTPNNRPFSGQFELTNTYAQIAAASQTSKFDSAMRT
jgi:hypothetical protein